MFGVITYTTRPNWKFTRYKLFLTDYDFEIRHCTGKLQPADFISRLEQRETVEREKENENKIENESITANQEKVSGEVEYTEDQIIFRSNSLEDNVHCAQEFSSKVKQKIYGHYILIPRE